MELDISVSLGSDSVVTKQVLSFQNACCATNSTSHNIHMCCRCAFCIKLCIILPDLGVLKITLKIILGVWWCAIALARLKRQGLHQGSDNWESGLSFFDYCVMLPIAAATIGTCHIYGGWVIVPPDCYGMNYSSYHIKGIYLCIFIFALACCLGCKKRENKCIGQHKYFHFYSTSHTLYVMWSRKISLKLVRFKFL